MVHPSVASMKYVIGLLLLGVLLAIWVFPGLPMTGEDGSEIAVYELVPGGEPRLIGRHVVPDEYEVSTQTLLRHDAFPESLEEYLEGVGTALVMAEVREVSSYIYVEDLGTRKVKRINSLVLLEVKEVLRGDFSRDSFYILLLSYGYDPETGRIVMKSTDVIYRPGETLIVAILGELGPDGLPSNMRFLAGLVMDKPVYTVHPLVFRVDGDRVSLKEFAEPLPLPDWATEIRDIPLGRFLAGLGA